jgi:hypothetical protein
LQHSILYTPNRNFTNFRHFVVSVYPAGASYPPPSSAWLMEMIGYTLHEGVQLVLQDQLQLPILYSSLQKNHECHNFWRRNKPIIRHPRCILATASGLQMAQMTGYYRSTRPPHKRGCEAVGSQSPVPIPHSPNVNFRNFVLSCERSANHPIYLMQ